MREGPDVVWFRNKYSLPPNDPRLLALTDTEIALERELQLWMEDAPLRRCATCDVFTYREICPFCSDSELKAGPTGDPAIDDLLAKKDSGEKVSLADYFVRNEDGSYSGRAFDIENEE